MGLTLIICFCLIQLSFGDLGEWIKSVESGKNVKTKISAGGSQIQPGTFLVHEFQVGPTFHTATFRVESMTQRGFQMEIGHNTAKMSKLDQDIARLEIEHTTSKRIIGEKGKGASGGYVAILEQCEEDTLAKLVELRQQKKALETGFSENFPQTVRIMGNTISAKIDWISAGAYLDVDPVTTGTEVVKMLTDLFKQMGFKIMELLDAASVGCPHQVWWSNNKVSLIGIRMFQKKTPISWYGTFGFEPGRADQQRIQSGSEFFHKTATKEKTKGILDRDDPTGSKWKKVEGIVKSVDVVWADQSLGEVLSDVYMKSCVVYQELLWLLLSVSD
eukprot:140788_1